jgi:hypothetical protein
MSLTIGKTYQIVLNADLDGNTLPFPHTMVGTCLSFDKEYATFLDPMTNIVRGMKIPQGEPTEKDSVCKASSKPTVAPSAISKAGIAKKLNPLAPAPKDPAASPPAPKDSAAPVPSPAPAEALKSDIPPDATDEYINKQLLDKFKAHDSKETKFKEDFTADLEFVKNKIVQNTNKKTGLIYSITGGLEKNPAFLGTNFSNFINDKYKDADKTCFFVFNTKKLLKEGELSTEILFLVALPKSECDKYPNHIPFKRSDKKP